MANAIWLGASATEEGVAHPVYRWDTAANWSTGAIPTSSDDATISAGVPVATLQSTTTVKSVTVDYGGQVKIGAYWYIGGQNYIAGRLTVLGDFTSNSAVGIDSSSLDLGGSTLSIGGVLTQTNSGSALTIGNALNMSSTTVTAASATNSGTINIIGGTGLSSLTLSSAAGTGGQAGVLSGIFSLTDNALLDFAGGGTINTIADGGLWLNGASAHIASGDAIGANSALSGPLTVSATGGNAGGLIMQAGAFVTISSLTITGSVGVDTGFLGQAGSYLGVSGAIANSGALSIGRSAFSTTPASSSPWVAAASISNSDTATISVDGDANQNIPGVLRISSAAGFGTAGVLTGSVILADAALIDFLGGGQIDTIASKGRLSMNGPKAFLASGAATTSNSALTGPLTVSANAGLDLHAGVNLSLTSLTDAGSIAVDTDFLGVAKSSISVSGALDVSGSLSIGRSAFDAASVSPIVSVGSVSNTGSISVSGDATLGVPGKLLVASAAGFGTAGVLTGSVSLTEASLIDFLGGGQINTIGWPGNLYIDGAHAFLASGAATTSNSALQGLSEVDGAFAIMDGASVSTTGGVGVANGHGAAINVDGGGAGGSTLAMGGALTINSYGNFAVGNSGITASTTVSTSAILTPTAGASGISINGSTTPGSSSKASVLVGSAAGFGSAGVLSGALDLSLRGNSLLQFASGQIHDIAWETNVSLDGAKAFIADAGATDSNSALHGLTEVDGALILSNGASIATTAGLGIAAGHYATVNVDAGGVGGSTLSLGGALALHEYARLNLGCSWQTAAANLSATALSVSGGAIMTVSGASGGASNAQFSGAASNAGDVTINQYAQLVTTGYTQTAGSTDVAGTLAAPVTLAGGTLEISSTGAVSGEIVFAGVATLKLDGAAANIMSGFTTVNDKIDLRSVAYAAGEHMVLLGSSGGVQTWAVENASDAVLATVSLRGIYGANVLGVRNDGSGFAQITRVAAPIGDRSDFAGDGRSDVLFRNGAGVSYLWTMNGATVASGATTSVQVGLVWQIKGVADFDGNGTTDLLWAYSNAANAADPLNGVSYISFQDGASATDGSVVQQLSGAWAVVGVADFNGDGRADVLYRDSGTGQSYLDVMNGAAIDWSASGFTSQQVTDTRWTIAAVADFDGSGGADILWRYSNASDASDPLNGALYEWAMNGSAVVGAGLLSQQPGANWGIVGTGDFDGDGMADLLFRYANAANAADPLNGMTYVDFMSGQSVTSGAPTQWQVDNSWAVAAIGDFNADGKSDVMWQQASTGSMYLWTMNGATVSAGSTTSTQPGLGWSVQNGVLLG